MYIEVDRILITVKYIVYINNELGIKLLDKLVSYNEL